MNATYTIPACNLSRFADEVAKLNKRARRIGCAEITFTTTPAYTEREFLYVTGTDRRWASADEPDPDARYWTATGRLREWLTLTVAGDAPKFNGWEFAGTLAPLPVDGGLENEVRACPGHVIPKEYRSRVGECDHCRTTRRRTETFVLKHDSGEHKMVGRQCLKDFLGHKDPHSLASEAELLATLHSLARDAEDDDWGGGGGGGGESIYEVESFLAVASAMIRVDGWLSRGRAFETGKTGHATADDVLRYFNPPSVRFCGEQERREWEKWVAARGPNDSDKERADKAVEWAMALTEKDLENDYLYNVNLVARAGLVRSKSAGVAASIIAAYDKDCERRKARESRGESNWVGVVGKRQTMRLTTHKVIQIDGQYGLTGLHIMSDDAGNDVKWFASSGRVDGDGWLTIGVEFEVKATVKAHEEYKGRKQTIVNRVSKVCVDDSTAKKGRKTKTA